MLAAIIILSLLALFFGLVLGFAAVRFKVESEAIIDQIDAVLPQTQCGSCGYPGCRPYAEAIARGEADINQCPPGGQAGVDKLAELLGRDSKPLSEEHGEEKTEQTVAIIDEQTCIGCTLCIQACPVDAILGASKQMHTVIEEECTGCELCIEPCPVECITMEPVSQDIGHWTWPSPDEEQQQQDTGTIPSNG